MQIGDRVRRLSTGEVGVVLRVDGPLVQLGLSTATTTVHRDDLRPLGKDPGEQLAAGELGHALPHGLRLQARYLRHAYRYDPLSGLSNARIEPQLHQLYVAHRVMQKLAPRMILADEVGLGKTIEAGLILKELRARGVVERVLIVVPANLQLQWQQELASKFNERFEIIDGAAVKHLGRNGDNAWAKADNVICSLPFARSRDRIEQITTVPWDLVVFDEAHRVRRSADRTTLAYELADELADLTFSLLLLTATPMQLDPHELYSHIDLIEPGLYPNAAMYEYRRRDLPRLNAAMRGLQRWPASDGAERDAFLRTHHSLLRELGIDPDDEAHLLDDDDARNGLMDALVDEHPLSQVMVRNRKAEVGGFTSRHATRRLIEPTDDEIELYEEITEYLRTGYNAARASRNNALGFLMVTYHKMLASSAYALHHSFLRRVAKLEVEAASTSAAGDFGEEKEESLREAVEVSSSVEEVDGATVEVMVLEAEIAQLRGLAARLSGLDESKPHALLDVLDEVAAQQEAGAEAKVLVFTQFVETQTYLANLLEANGYSVAVFNGRMGLEEKETAARQFREETQIMVSTEAGGEGRNFQFCHVLINYDLPWNPMKVEQRIGRIDRIGQRHPVKIYNLGLMHTVEERVLQVLERRIRLFEESVGSLDPILGEMEREIEAIALADPRQGDEQFSRFERDIEQRVREAREAERTLADFVMDRASLRRDIANDLLDRSPLARFSDLQAFVGRALEYLGGVMTEGEHGEQIITLSPELARELRTRTQVHRGAFDPKIALEHEELDFFAFGHDLVESLLDLATHGEPVVATAQRVPELENDAAVELYYELQSSRTPQPSGRFLRHLVTAEGVVGSTSLTAIPPVGVMAREVEVPEWVTSAVQVSREAANGAYLAFRDSVRERHELTKGERLERAERLYGYRVERLQHRIMQDQVFIEEKEAFGSAKDKRILPAIRGRIRKNQGRLEDVAREYEAERKGIEEEQADADLQLVSAALLLPATGGSR